MYYVWGTRMLTGDYSYEFSLFPFDVAWTEADLHRDTLEYNFPARAVTGEPGSGKQGSRMAPISIESEGVIASALLVRGANQLQPR